VRRFVEGLDEAVIIEHKAGYFTDIVDRIYVLSGGRLVEAGPDELEGEPILEGLDISVERGEAVALVGPNGSGKSTILKTLAGFIEPLGGDIELYVEPLYLPQEPDIFFLHPTVREEIMSVSGEEGLSHFPSRLLDMPPYLLSHGERRRLLNLLAMLYGHGLLLLDEPTTGLDPPSLPGPPPLHPRGSARA